MLFSNRFFFTNPTSDFRSSYPSRAEAMFRKPYHLCPPKQPEKCGPGADPKKKLWLNQNYVAGLVSTVVFVLIHLIRSSRDDGLFFPEMDYSRLLLEK